MTDLAFVTHITLAVGHGPDKIQLNFSVDYFRLDDLPTTTQVIGLFIRADNSPHNIEKELVKSVIEHGTIFGYSVDKENVLYQSINRG